MINFMSLGFRPKAADNKTFKSVSLDSGKFHHSPLSVSLKTQNMNQFYKIPLSR